MWVWSILGSLVTSVSIISIIQRLGDIQLHKFPEEYLAYYRSIMSTLTSWIPLPFDLLIAQWYADLMSISVILILTVARTAKIVPIRHEGNLIVAANKKAVNKNVLYNLFTTSVTLFLMLLLAPLTIVWYLLYIFITYVAYQGENTELDYNYVKGMPNMKESLRMWFKTLSIMLVIIVLATVIFFIINYAAGE